VTGLKLEVVVMDLNLPIIKRKAHPGWDILKCAKNGHHWNGFLP